MSHVRPDTCAFEYTDAYRWAVGHAREDAQQRRKVLADRVRRLGDEAPIYLHAALRGYDDAIAFKAS